MVRLAVSIAVFVVAILLVAVAVAVIPRISEEQQQQEAQQEAQQRQKLFIQKYNEAIEPLTRPRTTLDPFRVTALNWQPFATEDDGPNPYCDLVSDEYMQSGGVCHDRKDASDTTGLFTCNDGTHKTDWRDCKDATEDEGEEEVRELWWTTDKVEPCIVKPKAINLTIPNFRELQSPVNESESVNYCPAWPDPEFWADETPDTRPVVNPNIVLRTK